MGYESALHLIDIKIRPDSLPQVLRALKGRKSQRLVQLRYFFERATVDSNGFLAFTPSENYPSPYVPDENGTVPALSAKWYEDEQIARWLKRVPSARVRDVISPRRVVFAANRNRNDYDEIQKAVPLGLGARAPSIGSLAQNSPTSPIHS